MPWSVVTVVKEGKPARTIIGVNVNRQRRAGQGRAGRRQYPGQVAVSDVQSGQATLSTAELGQAALISPAGREEGAVEYLVSYGSL